jgi:ApaG protein
MYRAVTRQIEVTVEPNFLPERSSVDRGQYFWSYTIVITNTGAETVQLRTRHWIITDATGRKQEVRGEGVVGEQPVLAPGERFEYTRWSAKAARDSRSTCRRSRWTARTTGGC